MKPKIITIVFLFLISMFGVDAQTIISLSDNMEIASNSEIRIEPGDYDLEDQGDVGIIRIINKENITIDGDSVSVDGQDFGGYLIYVENSKNITIKNFSSVKNFYYAVRAEESQDLAIHDNDFSYNQKDTVGWISIWTEVGEALGGGILLHECRNGEVYGNTGTQQNDGLAMYNCESFEVYDNVFNWNCGFGVRMNFTNNCHVHHNDLSHVNRETDPSDCAAILLIVSNNNNVEYNDLTWSGDGIFLGQYKYHDIPNNNVFAYNDCSHSPHNAIEATFADGNTFTHNKCNYSNYGFWLGYSYNSHVEGNEIIGNYTSGVAVDRGFNNTFLDNEIRANPYGFELWEGGVINPYGEQFSHDYFIRNNLIEGNTYGIHARNTEHLVAAGNEFKHNRIDVYLEGESFNDTITENVMKNPTEYFIQNMSADNIYAINNTIYPNDRELIMRKMRGEVNWRPFGESGTKDMMYIPPCDMAEPPAQWNIYADPGMGSRITESLEWDYEEKKVGIASIRLVTGRGWDVGVNYHPGGDSVAMWNLSEDDTLRLWVKTIKNPVIGFQYFHIRVGNYDQGFYKYTAATSYLNNAHKRWRHYEIPLRGNSRWERELVGNMDPGRTHYVEIHADTWDFGYTLWVDGLQFGDCTPMGVDRIYTDTQFKSYCYPNPVRDEAFIEYYLGSPQKVELKIYSINGEEVLDLVSEWQNAGKQRIRADFTGQPAGIYFYRLRWNGGVETGKVIAR